MVFAALDIIGGRSATQETGHRLLEGGFSE
jgi:hypothetical protein